MTPTAAALLGYALWTLLLVMTMGVLRTLKVQFGGTRSQFILPNRRRHGGL